jgi:hypothetical protein
MNRLPPEPDDKAKDTMAKFLEIGEKVKAAGITPEKDREMCRKALSLMTVEAMYEAAGRNQETMLAMTFTMKDFIDDGVVECTPEDLGHILMLIGLSMATRGAAPNLNAGKLGLN